MLFRSVGGMSRDEIAANYMEPNDPLQAEGTDTIQACEDTHTTLRCNAPRLTFTKLQTQALMPPDQNVAPQLAQMPTGTRGIVPGETAPERMTRDVVWKDNQQHFGQDKTAPQQLEDETPVAQFVHNSGQQFKDTMSLTIGDLENRLHMVADDFEGPLQKAKDAAAPWVERWQAGYYSLSETGGEILGPVITCLNNLDATLKQEYTKMQAERVAIQLTVTALEQAVAKKEELNELGRKAREDANDARVLQLIDRKSVV